SREPQKDKVRVDFAAKHRFEIEFEKRLTRERMIVAQDSEAKPIRNDRPVMLLAAVQKLLNQAMRICGGRTTHAGGALVEIHVTTDEVYRNGTKETVDGIAPAADFRAGARREQSEPESPQKRQAPFFIRKSCPCFALGQEVRAGSEFRPVLPQTIPMLR